MTTQTQPIELYYFRTPNGHKVSMLLEELGVPYVIRVIHIGRGDQLKPEFLAISPNNKIPAIVDPEGPDGVPISIFESGAILQYLATKFGQFYPQDVRGKTKVDEWLFWQVGGFGPMLGQNNHFVHYAPEKVPYAIDRYVNETHRLYGVLDKQLAGQDFIAGEYSIADIATIGWANDLERQTMDPSDFPNVVAWRARVNARPAIQRAYAINIEDAAINNLADDKAAQAVLFGQRGK